MNFESLVRALGHRVQASGPKNGPKNFHNLEFRLEGLRAQGLRVLGCREESV